MTIVPGQVVTVNLALPEQSSTEPVADIVIDNPAALVAGSWSTGTSATDKYGDNYYFKGQGNGSAYLQYTPSIQTAGNYDVYTWHSQGSNRTLGAPHVVTHAQGTDTVYINQEMNGGAWNYVGTYSFDAGSSGYMRVTDAFADGGQVVIGDAIAFVYAGDSTPPPTATLVHVESILMSKVAAGGPWSYARATVEIRDSNGALVEGATVTGDFTGAIEEAGVSSVTGADGKTAITSTGKARNGTVTFTVTGVSGEGLEYDSSANLQTSGSITF